jgi:hypothetical protein
MSKVRLPPFGTLTANYPTDANGEQVKREIGGEMTQSWLGTNTCVMRMSKAFNYAGKTHEIPRHHKGLLTVRGDDKRNYAIRVAEFILYLNEKYGAPDIVKRGNDISLLPFLGKTGLIAWHITGWSDATGHFTLWDGSAGLYVGTHDYFNDFPTADPKPGDPQQPRLTQVDLWIC